ncbi:alkaline shock response membrane anchor protein AmaP [Streptomyces sp. NPDC060194]|uniref:alkaline shock response membrane anchor protein AmaP n=1 Tax=Streptomyces sp. NPDC060194 TaxID=3347069 RepID=UPI00366706C1
MRGSLNRLLLGLGGLVLLLFGGSVLATGLGAPVPSWWVYDGGDDVLLGDAERQRWRDEGWWWPVVIAALAVLVLLALWWLLAQIKGRRLDAVRVDTGDGEGALLRGRALEGVLEKDAAHGAGVADARARLTGRRHDPAVRIGLVAEPYAAPADVLDDLAYGALERARGSAGLERLPAEVRVRAARTGPERVD